MSRRRKPCPACLACGTTTLDHTLCTSGPPPPHGPACECDMCWGTLAWDVITAAQLVLEHPRSKPALARMAHALSEAELQPRRNKEWWGINVFLILEAGVFWQASAGVFRESESVSEGVSA